MAEGRTTQEGKLATSDRSDGRNTGKEGPRNTPAAMWRGPGGRKPGEEGKKREEKEMKKFDDTKAIRYPANHIVEAIRQETFGWEPVRVDMPGFVEGNYYRYYAHTVEVEEDGGKRWKYCEKRISLPVLERAIKACLQNKGYNREPHLEVLSRRMAYDDDTPVQFLRVHA